MKSVILFFVSIVFSFLTNSALCAEKTGAEIAQSCTMCHGENGLSKMPGTPSLAGQSEIYLVNQLRHFRDGQRQHEQMSVIAKPLTNADIDNVSAWFAQFEVELKKR
jgi:cytochrome c553